MKATEVVAERRRVQAEDLELVAFSQGVGAVRDFAFEQGIHAKVDHVLRDVTHVALSPTAERLEVLIADMSGRSVGIPEGRADRMPEGAERTKAREPRVERRRSVQSIREAL